ncbi:hypothetical protein LTR66_010486 [Elasticomyces elasticus]|nr:hypothetical protein LTR66_010486 [Elasticomyces elasticus]
MMSYAEYPHAMPLHDNDFPLFPQYSDYTATSQAYIPTNTYQEPGFPASAYGSYAAHHNFPGQQLHNFSFNVHNVAQGQKAAFNPHSPLYSPTNSASNSFDFQPPVLSSTSDSGASVQSALSSAMGSPSLNAQNSADWPSSTGLGISLNIVNPDSFARDPFATTSFEVESLLAQDKDLGCVGESGELSSCQSPQEVDRSSQSSSQFPSLVHHDSVESVQHGECRTFGTIVLWRGAERLPEHYEGRPDKPRGQRLQVTNNACVSSTVSALVTDPRSREGSTKAFSAPRSEAADQVDRFSA